MKIYMNDIYMSTEKQEESNIIIGGNKKSIEIPENAVWNIINSYFENDPYNLVKHHIDSYDNFMENGITKTTGDKSVASLWRAEV